MLLIGTPNLSLIKLLDCLHSGCLSFSGSIPLLSFYWLEISVSSTISQYIVSMVFQYTRVLCRTFWEIIFDFDFSPFRDTTDMAVRLFDALKVESQYFRLSIQEATNSLATAYKVY